MTQKLLIAIIDDNATDRTILENSLKEIDGILGNLLDIETLSYKFEDAKEKIELNILDGLFVDMQNNDNPALHGHHLLEHWRNIIGENFLSKVCLFTDDENKKWSLQNEFNFLNKVKSFGKTTITAKIASIVYDNFLSQSLLKRSEIQKKLEAYISANSSSKIKITSADSFEGIKTKDLIYITSKVSLLGLKNYIVHSFADGISLKYKKEKSNEFNKSFKSVIDYKFYSEVHYQAKNGNAKPDYKNLLQSITDDFNSSPKLFYKFDKYILNFRFIKDNGFSLQMSKRDIVKVDFILNYMPGGVTFKIEGLNQNIIDKLNSLVTLCRDTFE